MSSSRRYIPGDAQTPALPPEVLLSIISYIHDKNDLRHIRLSSKAFAPMAEPGLFDTVTLVPYRDCLEEFAVCMNANPRIAHHVQTLVCNVQLRCISDMSAKFLSHENKEVMTALGRNGLTDNDEEEEISLFADCLRSLPSLRTIRTVEVNIDLVYTGASISASDHPYFRHLLGSERNHFYFQQCTPSDDLTAAAQIAMLASSQVSGPPTVSQLEIYGADAFNIFADRPEKLAKRAETYREFIGQLKSIFLAFETPGTAALQEWGYSAGLRHTRENVGNLLASARQLDRLHFIGPDIPLLQRYEPVDYSNSWLADMLRNEDGRIRHQVTFPNLKVLELGNVVCCESELTALVKSNQHKLEKLVLYNIYLARHPDEQRKPCWVRTFTAVRECCVPKVMISGEFTNLGSQSWYVEPNHPLDTISSKPLEHQGILDTSCTLKRRMEEWLSGAEDTPCPIQFAAVNYDEMGNEIPLVPTDFLRYVPPGDKTWAFRTEDFFEGYPEEWEEFGDDEFWMEEEEEEEEEDFSSDEDDSTSNSEHDTDVEEI